MENWWNWPQIHCLSCTLRQKICRYSECRIWFFMKKVSTSGEQKKKHGSTWATSQDNWNDYEQWWGKNQTKSFYNDIKTNMIDLCCEFSYKKAISNKLSLPRKGFNKACLGPHGNKPVSLKLLLHRSTRKLPVFDSTRIHVNMKSLVELGETGVCPNHPHMRQQSTTVESYTT